MARIDGTTYHSPYSQAEQPEQRGAFVNADMPKLLSDRYQALVKGGFSPDQAFVLTRDYYAVLIKAQGLGGE